MTIREKIPALEHKKRLLEQAFIFENAPEYILQREIDKLRRLEHGEAQRLEKKKQAAAAAEIELIKAAQRALNSFDSKGTTGQLPQTLGRGS